MGRALFAVGVALVLCFTVLGGLIYLTREEDRIAVDNLLAEDMSRAIGTAEEERGGRVDLASVARFDWDEILLVAPGMPRDAISERLGYEWKGDATFGYTNTLIFLDRGRVERFADYRGEGVFEGFDRPFATIPRERSVLRVRNLVISP
ncbi:MAG: hypothetical protein M3P50_11095 [Actinomycetota bacterium]|nr:hypothetical protein [Actinomycetota bacterium]